MKKHFSSLSFLLLISVCNVRAQSNYIGPGIAMQFNGNYGNGIDVGDVYNTLTFPFTIEMWINLQAYPGQAAGIMGIDNDLTAYYGIYLSINPGGVVIMEFGDGSGSGSGNRRGYQTTTSLPLNRWVHLAATSSSVTDMHFYFNGVEQPKVQSSGTSTYTGIIHSSAHMSIGRTIDNAFEFDLNGILDEVRLWSTQRSQTDIRDYMCKKVDPATSGLIGYWTIDESYSGSSLDDQTIPTEDGTIIGTVTKLTSGAPIGDESSYTYTSNWSGVTVYEQDLTGDEIMAENISGSPYGVHVYEVKSFPYDTAGLDTIPSFYFGVFCAQQTSIPNYDLVYNYNSANGVINSSDEFSASLFRRDDGSVTTWSNANATLDTVSNSVAKNNESNRGEYILNVAYQNQQILFAAANNFICEKFCTAFQDLSANNPTQWYWMFPGGDPSTSSDQNPASVCYDIPGVYDVTLITTGPGGSDTLTLTGYMTVFSTPPFPTINQVGYTLTSSSAPSYQWQFNSVDIPGAVFQSYTVMQSGFYTVLITDANGCQNSTTVWVLIEGIDDLSVNHSFLISPNPASEKITLSFSEDESFEFIRIADMAGKVLKEFDGIGRSKMISIDVSELNNGMYLIEAFTTLGWRAEKIEVQK